MRSPEWTSCLSAQLKTNITHAIERMLHALYFRYKNDDINPNELLEGLSYVVAVNPKSKEK